MFERSPIFIFILLFINALFDGFTNPIKNAMIPFIEKKEYITSANALMNMMSSMVQLSTWALGGFLMSLIGAKYLFLFALVLEIYPISLLFNFQNDIFIIMKKKIY